MVICLRGRHKIARELRQVCTLASSFDCVAHLSLPRSRVADRAASIELVQRFRANIMISGPQPWDEDDWLTMVVDSEHREEQKVHLVARCGRCAVTTVDTHAAKSGPQPLRGMRKYRKIDSGAGMDVSPVFGMYGGTICAFIKFHDLIFSVFDQIRGVISVGATFEISERTNRHAFLTPAPR